MNLSELKENVLKLLNVDIDHLKDAVMDTVTNNKYDVYDGFLSLTDNNLSVDYLQQIYQYYYADREVKKQDYTPKTLADFTCQLIGEADIVVDMCAGSGALTIQRWNRNHNQKFRLYELDENVIPFLLFNLAIRNIDASVVRGNVLRDEVYEQWKITKGDKYGHISYIKSAI